MLKSRHGAGAAGFTMVELMIVIAIVAVAATLAAPGAAQMIAKRRVQAIAQSILDGLNSARVEAVRRNKQVSFRLNAGGTGWSLVEEGTNAVLRSHVSSDWAAAQVVSAGGASSVTFLPNGMRKATGVQLSEVDVSSPVENSGRRRVNVFGGGLIRMCDPGVDSPEDPRRC